MDFSAFKKSLADPENVYLLVSDQAYLRDRFLEFCEDTVPENARAFDWAVFDLEEAEAQEAISLARTLPWMGGHRWVYLRNAHAAEEQISEYLEDPADRTILVLETPKKVRKWSKLNQVTLGESSPAKWIRARVRKEGYQIEPEAVQILVDLVGDDLQQLASELEKQFLHHLESRKITSDSVLQLTTEGREHDIFELITALAERRGERALDLLRTLFESGMAAPQMVAMLYWSFSRLLVARERLEQGEDFFPIVKSLKIWSYRGKERQIRSYPREFLIRLLLRIREMDRLCKTTATDPRMLLERIIVDTCRK